jgi:DNA invertase Pin-like site-specific DNA recombinase
MRAAIYTRISDDGDGHGLGVRRQEVDCRALCEKLKWEVAGVYTDNDTSNFTRKPRPAYLRLMTDLEFGRVDALAVWDTDRLTRHPVELESVIELAERRGVSLASVGGEIDLATPQGRLTARIKASVARHEVEQASRRIRRKVLERAENGRPHGRVAYGWSRVNGEDVVLPVQAEVVREIAHRLVAGDTLRSIAQDLQRRGVPTPLAAQRWEPTMVRQLVSRERNVALRRHQRQVIGKGDWEPILDVDTYERVVAVLRDPRRRTSTTRENKFLLSGVAVCGLCNSPLRVLVANGTRPRAYACPRCYRIRRKQSAVDQLVTDLVIRRLSQPDALAAFSDDPGADAELREMEAHRAKLDSAADQYAEGVIDGEQLSRISTRLRPRLAELDARVKARIRRPDLADLARHDIGDVWSDLPLARKRAIIDVLMTVRVLPIGKSGRAEFDPKGVQVTWRQEVSANEPTGPS